MQTRHRLGVSAGLACLLQWKRPFDHTQRRWISKSVWERLFPELTEAGGPARKPQGKRRRLRARHQMANQGRPHLLSSPATNCRHSRVILTRRNRIISKCE